MKNADSILKALEHEVLRLNEVSQKVGDIVDRNADDPDKAFGEIEVLLNKPG